ncbi:O-antigen ligase [uncultured Massilia sp.]|uniref:O-antigen ligase family protein n=1 Tax=uncultured Massilia sp. TaxID=169973 RepID=UPI0025D79BCA|nr:O-antigen ligase family protein [uncultured Massilia sp.]
MNSNSTNTREPARIWIGTLAFLLPFLSLVTLFGVSLVSFLFLISALISFKPARDALRRHWPQIRWVVLAFLLHFLFVLACAVLRGASMGPVEKPARMLFAASALAMVLAARPPRATLWWGAAAGGLAALPFIAWQRLGLGIERPGGLINAITFGDLALLLGLLALVGAIDLRDRPRQALLAGAGALAGIAASLMTGTRGGWLGLLLMGLVLLPRRGMFGTRRGGMLLAGAAVVLAAVWFAPGLGLHARFVEGVDEARDWYAGGQVWTNVGSRLELWKGALMLVEERPLLGRDFEEGRARLAEYARAGTLDPMVLELPHLHNDGLQALATGGVVGFALWAAILAAPLAFFLRRLGRDMRAPQFAAALAGVVVVLGYMGFGLTEVIFWSMKGSLFYALMVFMLVGFCLNAKEKIG